MANDRTEQVRKWIINTNPDITSLDDNTDIVDSRIVTSLQFVELLLYIEEVCGTELDYDRLDIDSVRTLLDIEQNYLSHEVATASNQTRSVR